MKIHSTIKLIYLIIIVTSATIFFACKKNYDRVANPLPPVDTTVTASVSGRVTDLNDVPISNASVVAGTSTTTTDVNGQFTIKNAKLNADAGLVIITKPRYFEGSRTFLVDANTVNNVTIQLIPKTVSGTFDAASGGNINVSGGGSVNFGGSNVVNVFNGAAYTGNVSVSTFYLNPGDANFNKYMPGDLRGLNASGQQKILQSFGVVLAELNDANGGKLQIAAGKTATITIPIPSAMQANAPASIPLWYFNDTSGVWKQQGSATKQGNNYVGTVAHFSFWTAAQLGQSVKLNATFKEQNGKAVVNYLVTITSTDYGTTNGYTDDSGKVSGIIPAGETLWLTVIASCGLEIDSMNIGPYSADANLGTITLPIVVSNSVTLSGSVVNCNNAAVTNGYVQVSLGNTQINSPITNGSFSVTFSSQCSYSNGVPPAPPDSIIAYDVSTGQHSIPKSINGITGNQNIGQLVACAMLPPAPPIAGFTYLIGGANVPETVTFSNISSNATSYKWDFGDPASGLLDTSSLQNPFHVYTTAGTYTVTLSATGNGGTNSNSQSISITNASSSPDSSHINLTLNGTTFQWAYPDSIQAEHTDTANNTLITGGNINSMYFYILNDNTSPGSYSITLSATLNGISYPNNSATTTVTEYDAVGGYVTGTSSGQMMAADSTTSIPFTMTYRAKRKY